MIYNDRVIKNIEKDILKKNERLKEIKTQQHYLNIEKESIEKYIVEATETIGQLNKKHEVL